MKTIGFDGLNSSGKGTQIKLLKKYLDRNKISNLILRGDGLKAGKGLRSYDFPSSWWLENASFLLDKSLDAEEKLNLQYQRLAREYEFFQKKGPQEVILLDRSFPSRYFTMEQFFPGISLEDSLKSYNPKTKKPIKPIVPEKTIILHVGKNTLLNRINKKENFNLERRKFIEKVINKNYELFEKIIEKVCKIPGVYIIDGEKNKYFLSKEILEIYKNGK